MKEVPRILKRFFEGRGFQEYVVARTQATTLIAYILVILSAIKPNPVTYAAAAITTALNYYALKDFGERPYRIFFGGLNTFAAALWTANILRADMLAGLGVLAALIAFIAVFFIAYKRDHCKGTVLVADSEWAAVRVGYDLCSGVKSGDYVVKSRKGIRKGDEVAMKTVSHFGERVRPWEIISTQHASS
ncbi:MAG: DUF2101 family protein [Candidatus Diapherotrites archaeon]|nr:DUF2101 family protein [Candidatus Diapherotrites archaeon]